LRFNVSRVFLFLHADERIKNNDHFGGPTGSMGQTKAKVAAPASELNDDVDHSCLILYNEQVKTNGLGTIKKGGR
jgi:hypothetical protein